jgi:superfamily II DNA or RNA helicase
MTATQRAPQQPPQPGFVLRGYQHAAIASVQKALTAGLRRAAVVMPTGAGKTVVLAHLIAGQPPGTRTLVLAHRTELVDQAAAKIRAVCPELRVGVVRAEEDQHRGDVTVAMVQTISRPKRLTRVAPYDLIVVDECHHSTAISYKTVLDAWPQARAVGVTATLARADNARLGDIWQDVVYRIDILDLIDHQPPYLCDVRGYRVTTTGLDLAAVRTSHGDYQLGDLERRMGDAGAWEAAADAYRRYAAERRGVIFTPTVASAHTVAELMVAGGIPCEAVDGETGRDERAALLHRFQTGQTQVVANCGVLTEGFDNPAISCVTIARPTRSPVLYTQMAGRGLRMHPGKTDCLILDLVGATADHRLATLADLTGHDITEIAEGESLAEARVRHQVTSTTSTPYLGDITADEINLFGESNVIWPEWNGVRYVDLGHKGTVYIAPALGQPGRFDVIMRNRATGEEFTHLADRGLATALRSAEAVATRYGGALIRRGQRWQRTEPTDQQIAVMGRMRIPVPADCTRGMASELITAAIVANDFARRSPRGYQANREAPSTPTPRPATP